MCVYEVWHNTHCLVILPTYLATYLLHLAQEANLSSPALAQPQRYDASLHGTPTLCGQGASCSTTVTIRGTAGVAVREHPHRHHWLNRRDR